MIIPGDTKKKEEYLTWVINTCLDSKRDRKDLYDRRRQYFLHGTDGDAEAKYNRLESHLDLVSSFLYSPDHATFSIAAPLNSDDETVKQFIAAADHFNEDFRDAGLFDAFGDAMNWSLVFDSMFMKSGWSETREEVFARTIEPWKFGVFSEEETELDDQPAFVHAYHIDYDNAVQRLVRAGLGHRVEDLNVVNTPYESPFPDLITRMIISSTSGENLQGNVSGAINPTFLPRPSYQAKVDRPLVQFNELWVWDDEHDDYRVFFIVDPGIVISDSLQVIEAIRKSEPSQRFSEQQAKFYNTKTNPFFPKEHPFTHIRPYGIFDFFWGKAHIESVIPLQKWSNDRLEQISDILEKQAYPPRVGSGFMGLAEEKMDAFGGADSWVIDQLPQAQIKELYPQMPPDIFADYSQIGMLMMEASGLTDILQGKGTAGVRSKDHAKALQTTGGSRIKKAAIRLESPLVRLGDLTLKLKMRNDDEAIMPDPKEDGKTGSPFYYHNLGERYSMRIPGHAHSPLFADDTKELAAALFKAQAIDQEMLVRLLNPPNKDNIIHALRSRQKKAALQKAMHPEQEKKPAHGKPKAVA